MNIESNGADGIVRSCRFSVTEVNGGFGAFVVAVNMSGEGFVSESGRLPGLRMSQPGAFAVENELAVVNQVHAVGRGECLGAGADKVDMRALLEDQAGCQNRILDPLNARHTAGFHASAIHEKSIELDTTVRCKKTASTRIEGGVILKNHYGSLDSIESGASPREYRVPGFKSDANTAFVRGRVGCRNCPGTTVNEKDGSDRGTRCHVPMVVHPEGDVPKLGERIWRD